MFLGETATHRTTRLHSLELPAILYPTVNFDNNFTHGDAHRHFDRTRLDDIAANREGLGAFGFFRAHTGIPGRAVQNDLRHVRVGFYIIVVARLVPNAFN